MVKIRKLNVESNNGNRRKKLSKISALINDDFNNENVPR